MRLLPFKNVQHHFLWTKILTRSLFDVRGDFQTTEKGGVDLTTLDQDLLETRWLFLHQIYSSHSAPVPMTIDVDCHSHLQDIWIQGSRSQRNRTGKTAVETTTTVRLKAYEEVNPSTATQQGLVNKLLETTRTKFIP